MLGLALEFSLVVAIFAVAHRRQTQQRQARRARAAQLQFEFFPNHRREP